jgi:hypothetical protein
MVGRVPQVGSCPGSEKCRSRGEGAGAEDGEPGAIRVSIRAADGDAVARPGAADGHIVHGRYVFGECG